MKINELEATARQGSRKIQPIINTAPARIHISFGVLGFTPCVTCDVVRAVVPSLINCCEMYLIIRLVPLQSGNADIHTASERERGGGSRDEKV
jgi:hypothetical protein